MRHVVSVEKISSESLVRHVVSVEKISSCCNCGEDVFSVSCVVPLVLHDTSK